MFSRLYFPFVLLLLSSTFKKNVIISNYVINNMCVLYVKVISTVGIATGYGLDYREVGVRVLVGSRIFTSPCRPDRLWSPPSLLYSGYRVLFPRGSSGRVLKLTTHQLVPRSRKRVSIHPLPIRLHGVLLN
jgi:hypothetical protein